MSLPSSESANLSDRMKVLLSTANGADIHFLVGEEKKLFRAHKHILTLSSEVFEAMFRYDAQNAKSEEQSKPVKVPDIEPEAFRVMLSFIYADDFSGLNGENAMAVLYAAKKYSVNRLIGHCLQIPIPKLPNVFLAYAQARLLDPEGFAHQCLRYICQNARQLFGSEEFLQIDQNLLCELFERDQLLINDEFEIWQAALRWADEKWRQKGNNVCSAKKRRALLGPALFKIRFPLISPEEFTKSIVPSGVLTNDEFVSIYQFYSHPNLRGVLGLKTLKFPWHGRICDWNVAKGNRGTLALEIEKFSAFAREEVKSYRKSGTDVFINGLPWKIFAQITKKNDSTDKWLVFGFWCTAPKEDGNWSCKCSATLRIVSQKSGTEDFTRKYDRGFNNEMFCWRFPFLITFTELMDPSKGFYDKIEDRVIFTIDFSVEEEKGTKKRKLSDG